MAKNLTLVPHMTEGPMYQLAQGILGMFPNAVVTSIDSNELEMTDTPEILDDTNANINGDPYGYGHYIHVSMDYYGSVMAGLSRTVCDNGCIQIHASQDVNIPSLGDFDASERLHIVGTYLRAAHMRQVEHQRETVVRMDRAAIAGLSNSAVTQLRAIINSKGAIDGQIRSRAVMALDQMTRDEATLLGYITLATELSEHHLSDSAAIRVRELVTHELMGVYDLPRVNRQRPMPALFLPDVMRN